MKQLAILVMFAVVIGLCVGYFAIQRIDSYALSSLKVDSDLQRYNKVINRLRKAQFPQLRDLVYLDAAGAALYQQK